MKKLYTTDGVLRGYEGKNGYLLKHYSWGNDYQWLVSKVNTTYMSCEIMDALERGECFFVDSYKEGKEIIEKGSEK